MKVFKRLPNLSFGLFLASMLFFGIASAMEKSQYRTPEKVANDQPKEKKSLMQRFKNVFSRPSTNVPDKAAKPAESQKRTDTGQSTIARQPQQQEKVFGEGLGPKLSVKKTLNLAQEKLPLASTEELKQAKAEMDRAVEAQKNAASALAKIDKKLGGLEAKKRKIKEEKPVISGKPIRYKGHLARELTQQDMSDKIQAEKAEEKLTMIKEQIQGLDAEKRTLEKSLETSEKTAHEAKMNFLLKSDPKAGKLKEALETMQAMDATKYRSSEPKDSLDRELKRAMAVQAIAVGPRKTIQALTELGLKAPEIAPGEIKSVDRLRGALNNAQIKMDKNKKEITDLESDRKDFEKRYTEEEIQRIKDDAGYKLDRYNIEKQNLEEDSVTLEKLRRENAGLEDLINQANEHIKTVQESTGSAE